MLWKLLKNWGKSSGFMTNYQNLGDNSLFLCIITDRDKPQIMSEKERRNGVLRL